MAHQKGRVHGSHKYTRLGFLTRPFHPHLPLSWMYFMQVISIHMCPEFEAFPNLEHIAHQWGTEGATPVRLASSPTLSPYIFDHVRLFVYLFPSLFLSKRFLCPPI